MSNLISLTSKLADRFGMEGDGVMETLKATAFKGPVSDAQMTALLIVAKHVEIDPETNCWNWQKSLSRGYGSLSFRGEHLTAHRFSYREFVAPIADGNWILHRCDNRACVNPTHLYQGTAVDNRRDTLERSGWSHPYRRRKTCFSGHSYEAVGYRIASDGSRVCRECQKLSKRKQRAALKEKAA